MNRKRVGLTALLGGVFLLVAVQPAAAQAGASSTTEQLIQNLNGKLIYVAVPITVLVEGILLYTVIKFNRTDEAKPTQENRRLEITWTVATAVILLFVGVATYQVLGNVYVSASAQQSFEGDDVTNIDVVAQKYSWIFEYPDVTASDVSAGGLTLENVSIADTRVVEQTENGVRVAGGTISGDGVDSGTLVNGTVQVGNAEANTTTSFEDVTVASAAIEDASISGDTVTTSQTAVFPNERNVALNLTSRDWIHSFHVPDLGLKQDALPGQYNHLRTKPTGTGTYQLYCAEYCGVGHSNMLGSVEVVPQDEFDEWLVDQWASSKTPA
jgi:cytochrome c oxidase subunit 2